MRIACEGVAQIASYDFAPKAPRFILGACQVVRLLRNESGNTKQMGLIVCGSPLARVRG